MERVRLLSTTAVLTLLVWASADSLVNETGSVSVTFDLSPPGTDRAMLVQVADDAPAYELKISGPHRLIAELRGRGPIHIPLTMPELPTGTTTIALQRQNVRQSLSMIGSEYSKLSVISILPDRLPVIVDHMAKRDAVVVLKNLTLSYDVAPQLSQSRVSVTMRESELSRLPSGQTLQLDITHDVERLLATSEGGVNTTVPVQLDAPRYFGPGATVVPRVVNVSATVQAQRATAEISTVPILLAVSFANLERPLRPVGRDGSPLPLMTQTILVTGREEQVRRLQQGETRAYGVIHLKQGDLDGTGELKLVTPEYRLPDGISLARTPLPIEFKLVDARAVTGTDH